MAPVAQINQQQLAFLHWLAEEDSARQSEYTAYREYYDGDHDTQLTARQRKYLQIKIGEQFNDNHCPTVVDALAERLTVTGFEAEGQDEALWDWWEQNRMDGTQRIVHLAAVRDGDSYLIVEWDNDDGSPVFIPELAYDGIDGVKVHYSKIQRDVIEFASKRWRIEQGEGTGKQRRLNLYFPDRIEKYISDSDEFEGDWQPFQEEGEAWPIPWVDSKGEPLGVPVVHFKNKEQGYSYGQSELKNVVPLQNALNKSIIDLLAAADTTGFRIFWMLGDDPSGLEIAPGSFIYSLRPAGGEEGASVGFFPGEDLSPLIALKDSFVMEIARVSRTPISYFQISGLRPAEGTLKQEETGLVARAIDRHAGFGNSWEDALAMARRLFNTFGPEQMDEEQTISATWKDPVTRNEKEHLESLKFKNELGVPQEKLWVEMGYNADEVAEMKAMRGEEQAASSNIGGELLRAFEGGGQIAGAGEREREEV